MNKHISRTTYSQRQLRVGELIKQNLGEIFIRNEAKIKDMNTEDVNLEHKKIDVQKEFDRFKMDYVQVAPRKLVGDPKGNREARQFVATMVESGLSQLINSPEYINEPSDLIKKKMLTTRLNAARNEALAYATGAKEWDTDNDIIRKNCRGQIIFYDSNK